MLIGRFFINNRNKFSFYLIINIVNIRAEKIKGKKDNKKMIDIAIQAFVTLFVIIDPIGAIPVFIGLTDGTTYKHRRLMAIKAVLIALGVLALFAISGDWIFKTLGIAMYSFTVCGGIMLFLIALEMVFEKRNPRRERSANKMVEDIQEEDISVFPMAIPLLAGPGTITSLILLMSKHQEDVASQVMVFGVLVIVLLICLVLFLSSEFISKTFGDTFTNILTRLFGIVLAALSVQFIFDGIGKAFGISV